MSVTTEEAIPLTIVCKKLGVEDAMFEVMIVDVPTEPPMFDVRVLLDEESVLVVFRLAMVAEAEVRSEIVVVARLDVPVAVRVPTVRLDVVALVAVRLVKNEVTPFKSVAKRFVEVLLVVEAFVAVSVEAVRLVNDEEAEVRSLMVALEIVVVARPVTPITTKSRVEAEEMRLERRLVFSSHSVPSQ